MAISKPVKIELTELIKQELIRLRILPNLLGHHYLAYAIEQVVLDPLRIKGITKSLYPEIAQIYHTTNWHTVEHAVRSALEVCWNRGGREALDGMAGCHLTKRPKAKEFISVVAAYISITYHR